MAAICKTVHTTGNGKPLYATLDVTPSWWRRKKLNAYGAVASRIQKGFFLGGLAFSAEHIQVSTPLFRDDPLEPRVLALIAVLEEMGSEWAEPA